MRTAIYPGTFDPVTYGHLDVLRRACVIFDKVIIAVAHNPHKNPVFSVRERLAFIQANLPPGCNIEATSFNGLLVDFAHEVGAVAIVRGLRAVSDFEFEFQMTQMNRELDGGIETIFFMPGQDYFFTSSSSIKQVAQFSPRRVAKYVPPQVAAALKKKFRSSSKDK